MRAMVILGAALVLGCQTPSPAPPSTADDEAAIRAVMQGFDSAWNAADTVALREYLEEDLMAFRRGADGRWRLVATN